MRLELADYAEMEALLFDSLSGSVPADGIEERAGHANALAIELQLAAGSDGYDTAIKRAVSRFRAAVHRQSRGTIEIIDVDLLAWFMVMISQKWANLMIERAVKGMRQELRDAGIEAKTDD